MRYPSVLFFYLSTLSYFVTFVLYLLHVVFHPHPGPSPLRGRGETGVRGRRWASLLPARRGACRISLGGSGPPTPFSPA
jgi:hypothetical protein